jgi:Xaa-Pro aminopeptidase
MDPRRIALNISRDNHLADGLTVGSYRSLLKMLGEPYRDRIVSSEEYLQKLRSIKTPEEISYIRTAISLTLEIYEEVFAALRPGMTEVEVGDLFVAGMRARGVVNGISRDLSPPIVMKHKIAHRPPGEGILEAGDYLIMDFSVDYKGYCSDIARTAYILGPGEARASEAMEQAFRTVRSATEAALSVLKPGAVGKDVDHAARQYVLDRGYPNIFHAVGHQLGRDVHDGGTILGPEKQRYRKAARGSIEAGMVFAVEPTILYEEGPAIISEDNYLVTDEGPELLGEPQRELVLIGPEGRVAGAAQ